MLKHLSVVDQLKKYQDIFVDVNTLDKKKIQELEKYPEMIDLVGKWSMLPDRALLPDLIKYGEIIQDLYQFNQPVKLYRGFNPTREDTQITMGLDLNKALKLKVGKTFTYRSEWPLAMSTTSNVAGSYGNFIVSAVLNPLKTPLFFFTNELIYLAKEFHLGSAKVFPFINYLSTSKEVILLPPYNETFTVFENNL